MTNYPDKIEELKKISTPGAFRKKLLDYFHAGEKEIIYSQELISIIKDKNIQYNTTKKPTWKDLFIEIKNIKLDEDSLLMRSINANYYAEFSKQLNIIYTKWHIHPDDLSINGQSLFQLGVQRSINLELTQTLLDAPYHCSIDQKDQFGRHLSHLAAQGSTNYSVFYELITRDIVCIENSIQRLDDFNLTPLCYAVDPDQFKISNNNRLREKRARLVHNILSCYENNNIDLHPNEYLLIKRNLIEIDPAEKEKDLQNFQQFAYFFAKLNNPYLKNYPGANKSFSQELDFFQPLKLPWDSQNPLTLKRRISVFINNNNFLSLSNQLTKETGDHLSASDRTPDYQHHEQELALLRIATDQGRYAMIGLLKNILDINVSQINQVVLKVLNSSKHKKYHPKALNALLTYPHIEQQFLSQADHLIALLIHREQNSPPNSEIREQWQSLRQLCQFYNINYQYNCLVEAISTSQITTFEHTFNQLIQLQGKQQTLYGFQCRYNLPLAHYVTNLNAHYLLKYLACNHPDVIIEGNSNGQTALHKATQIEASASINLLLTETPLTPFDHDHEGIFPIDLTDNIHLKKLFFTYNDQAEAKHFLKMIDYFKSLAGRTNNLTQYNNIHKLISKFTLFYQAAQSLTSDMEQTIAVLCTKSSPFNIDDMKDPNGNTVLHIAVLNAATPDLIKSLVSNYKANPFSFNKANETPLSLSATKEDTNQINILLSNHPFKHFSDSERHHLKELQQTAQANMTHSIVYLLEDKLGYTNNSNSTNQPNTFFRKRHRLSHDLETNCYNSKRKATTAPDNASTSNTMLFDHFCDLHHEDDAIDHEDDTIDHEADNTPKSPN